MASASYLSIGCGFQETETVPEALAGQTQLNLLLQDGGSALQDNLVILHPKHRQTLIHRPGQAPLHLSFHHTFVFEPIFCGGECSCCSIVIF